MLDKGAKFVFHSVLMWFGCNGGW